MLNAVINTTFQATANDAPTGLTGTIGVEITTATGVEYTPRTTEGIVETNVDGEAIYTVTLTAPSVPGDYLIVWTTSNTDERAEEPLRVDFALAWAPTVTELGQLIPGRAAARFTGGSQPGDPPSFPDTNRVQAVIDMAGSLVAPRLGITTLPLKFHPMGKALIVLRAAMLLEPAAWPEQARPDKSAYEQWREQFNDDITALITAVKQDAADGDTGDGGPETLAGFGPAGGFPPPGILPRQHIVFDPALPTYPYTVQDW